MLLPRIYLYLTDIQIYVFVPIYILFVCVCVTCICFFSLLLGLIYINVFPNWGTFHGAAKVSTCCGEGRRRAASNGTGLGDSELSGAMFSNFFLMQIRWF